MSFNVVWNESFLPTGQNQIFYCLWIDHESAIVENSTRVGNLTDLPYGGPRTALY
jgi:hypothetical protein